MRPAPDFIHLEDIFMVTVRLLMPKDGNLREIVDLGQLDKWGLIESNLTTMSNSHHFDMV